MKHAYYKVVEDFSSGEIGLQDSRMTQVLNTPSAINNSILFAHDLVEHVNGVKRIGTVADELEALGAMYFVRGVVADFLTDRPITPEYAISQDIIYLAEEVAFTSEQLYGLKLVPRDEEAEEFWQSLVDDGHFKLSSDLFDLDVFQEFLTKAKQYWLLGYHKAERLYGNSIRAFDYFADLKYISDPLFKPGFSEEDLGRTFMLKHHPNSKPILKETTRGRFF